MQVQEPTKLTNLQLELLKIFSFNTSDKELADIKNLLSKYFAEKARDEMDTLWDERGWSDDTKERWLKEHKRP